MLKLSHLKRSAVISAVVGTVLTLTNQYEAVMGDQALNLVKTLITYTIPFCVSLISALLEKKRVMKEVTVAKCSFEPLEAVKNDLASITSLSDKLRTSATRVNATSINRLASVQEFSKIAEATMNQFNNLNASQIVQMQIIHDHIGKVIEDTEAVVAGSAKNIGVGDELLSLSTKVNSEIERLVAEG